VILSLSLPTLYLRIVDVLFSDFSRKYVHTIDHRRTSYRATHIDHGHTITGKRIENVVNTPPPIELGDVSGPVHRTPAACFCFGVPTPETSDRANNRSTFRSIILRENDNGDRALSIEFVRRYILRERFIVTPSVVKTNTLYGDREYPPKYVLGTIRYVRGLDDRVIRSPAETSCVSAPRGSDTLNGRAPFSRIAGTCARRPIVPGRRPGGVPVAAKRTIRETRDDTNVETVRRCRRDKLGGPTICFLSFETTTIAGNRTVRSYFAS